MMQRTGQIPAAESERRPQDLECKTQDLLDFEYHLRIRLLLPAKLPCSVRREASAVHVNPKSSLVAHLTFYLDSWVCIQSLKLLVRTTWCCSCSTVGALGAAVTSEQKYGTSRSLEALARDLAFNDGQTHVAARLRSLTNVTCSIELLFSGSNSSTHKQGI
eukprot:3660249-Amphidinium_carterae.1